MSLLGDPLPTLSLTLHRLWQEAVEKEMTQLGKPEGFIGFKGAIR